MGFTDRLRQQQPMRRIPGLGQQNPMSPMNPMTSASPTGGRENVGYGKGFLGTFMNLALGDPNYQDPNQALRDQAEAAKLALEKRQAEGRLLPGDPGYPGGGYDFYGNPIYRTSGGGRLLSV